MDWTQAHMLSLWAGFQLVNRKEFKRRLQSVKKALFDHFHRQVVAQFFDNSCIFHTFHRNYSTVFYRCTYGPDFYLVWDVKLRKTVCYFWQFKIWLFTLKQYKQSFYLNSLKPFDRISVFVLRSRQRARLRLSKSRLSKCLLCITTWMSGCWRTSWL